MTDNVVKGNFKPNAEDALVDKLLDKGAPENSTGYNMVQVMYCPEELDRVPDLLTGGDRNRRWGAMVSLAIIPHVDRNPKGSITLPTTPIQFFDGDSLEDIRDRLVYEIDKAIEMSKLSTEDPEAFQRVHDKVMTKIAESAPQAE